MNENPLIIAACAPATCGFVPKADERVTERIIDGRVTNVRLLAAHVERLLDHHVRLIERAGRADANLVVIPEDCLRLGALVSRHRGEAGCAAAIDAAFARYDQRMGDLCRRFQMCIVGGTVTRRGRRFANTAVMHDDKGRIIARYDKTHLPDQERGVYTPGGELPVFETPLGRIGLLICWDIVFPEPYAMLALQGAELIVQPTFGHDGERADITARSRVQDWSVPLAISMWGGSSGIIDAAGNYVARTGYRANRIAVGTLDLKAPRSWLFLKDMRREMPMRRRPELYGRVAARKENIR
jgi:predicted amidohydrolase